VIQKDPPVRPTASLRHLLVVTAAATALLTAAGPATAAPAAAPPAAAPYAAEWLASRSALYPIADLSAQRLATADLVAAAKWGTGAPIDDPAREEQVLNTVAAQAEKAGADPEQTRRIFRDQIEANKMVQRALHRRWAAHPAEAPTTRPDLNDVRQEINRINEALVSAIADSASDRFSPLCPVELGVSAVYVRHQRQLDALHSRALDRALRSVCGAWG
jgi:chorismate mutase